MRRRFTSSEVETSFWKRVRKTQGCWDWAGSIHNSTGYGYFYPSGETVLAHRFSYELNVGTIPEGLTIDHLCKNRRCVQPEHMEVVTIRVNLLRGDGFSGKNHRKTHCPSGHPYAGDNLIVTGTGWRQCRRCHRKHQMKYDRESGSSYV